jgi:hypothetical protein
VNGTSRHAAYQVYLNGEAKTPMVSTWCGLQVLLRNAGHSTSHRDKVGCNACREAFRRATREARREREKRRRRLGAT